MPLRCLKGVLRQPSQCLQTLAQSVISPRLFYAVQDCHSANFTREVRELNSRKTPCHNMSLNVMSKSFGLFIQYLYFKSGYTLIMRGGQIIFCVNSRVTYNELTQNRAPAAAAALLLDRGLSNHIFSRRLSAGFNTYLNKMSTSIVVEATMLAIQHCIRWPLLSLACQRVFF